MADGIFHFLLSQTSVLYPLRGDGKPHLPMLRFQWWRAISLVNALSQLILWGRELGGGLLEEGDTLPASLMWQGLRVNFGMLQSKVSFDDFTVCGGR
ncbi:MAG: hypothetical protein AB4040_12595 [Synechococcus sp.]